MVWDPFILIGTAVHFRFVDPISTFDSYGMVSTMGSSELDRDLAILVKMSFFFKKKKKKKHKQET